MATKSSLLLTPASYFNLIYVYITLLNQKYLPLILCVYDGDGASILLSKSEIYYLFIHTYYYFIMP